MNLSARLTLAALFAASLWLGGLYGFTRDVAEPSSQDSLKPVDAIVVLTGGTRRLDTGFDMLEKGLGEKLFISGVYKGVEVKELLRKWKRPSTKRLDCCVELGFEADDTLGNAREATAWLRKEKFRTYYLVTANYHLKRALVDFRALGPELTPLPHAVQPESLDMLNWWRDPANRSLILREYNKYIAALLLRPFTS